jgi:hypothetical protein
LLKLSPQKPDLSRSISIDQDVADPIICNLPSDGATREPCTKSFPGV